jgi:hypothetical protein
LEKHKAGLSTFVIDPSATRRLCVVDMVVVVYTPEVSPTTPYIFLLSLSFSGFA